MRICTIASTERSDLGQSIEARKWELYYKSIGIQLSRCRGSIVNGDTSLDDVFVIPEISAEHPSNVEIMHRVISLESPQSDQTSLRELIDDSSETIYHNLRNYLREQKIDAIHVDNLSALPICIPFGSAIARLVEKDHIPVVSRDHDFVWERFLNSHWFLEALPDLPLAHPLVFHATLTQHAMTTLQARRNGILGCVVPNLFDFSHYESSHQPSEFRKSLDIAPDDIMLLQPTRFIPTKGIHHAIHMASRLQHNLDRRAILVVSGAAVTLFRKSGESQLYNDAISELADRLGVRLILLDGVLLSCPGAPHAASYCMYDAYLGADLVTFPTVVEGFGNPVVESVAARRPLFTTQYPVMANEFLPKGLRFITIPSDPPPTLPPTGRGIDLDQTVITEEAVAMAGLTLNRDHSDTKSMLNHNWQIGKALYSDEPVNRHAYFAPIRSWLSQAACK